MAKQEELYNAPDMKEFLALVTKRFCPNCGKALIRNEMGRPRVYCSDRCRKQYWNTHVFPERWDSYETMICPVCGRLFQAKKLSTRQRKYCSRACASRSRFINIRKDGET